MDAEEPTDCEPTFDDLIAKAAEPSPQAGAVIPAGARFVLVGDMICIEAEGCTCGSGGSYGHEPYCGIEPFLRLDEIKNADVEVEYGVNDKRAGGDGRRYRRYAAGDLMLAEMMSKDLKAPVEKRFVLRSRWEGR